MTNPNEPTPAAAGYNKISEQEVFDGMSAHKRDALFNTQKKLGALNRPGYHVQAAGDIYDGVVEELMIRGFPANQVACKDFSTELHRRMGYDFHGVREMTNSLVQEAYAAAQQHAVSDLVHDQAFKALDTHRRLTAPLADAQDAYATDLYRKMKGDFHSGYLVDACVSHVNFYGLPVDEYGYRSTIDDVIVDPHFGFDNKDDVRAATVQLFDMIYDDLIYRDSPHFYAASAAASVAEKVRLSEKQEEQQRLGVTPEPEPEPLTLRLSFIANPRRFPEPVPADPSSTFDTRVKSLFCDELYRKDFHPEQTTVHMKPRLIDVPLTPHQELMALSGKGIERNYEPYTIQGCPVYDVDITSTEGDLREHAHSFGARLDQQGIVLGQFEEIDAEYTMSASEAREIAARAKAHALPSSGNDFSMDF